MRYKTDWNPQLTETAIVTTYDNVSVYSESEVTDYVGNKVYKDGSLKMILIDGGYIEKGNYYYLTDHLGNNRVVADASGKIIQKTHYEPFGKAFEDGEGLDKQPYLFGGKEFYAQHGLNLYDSEARWYDPDGWLPTQDPLAEKFYSWSPYVYAFDNPMRFVDPTGMSPEDDKDKKDDFWSQFREAIKWAFSQAADEITFEMGIHPNQFNSDNPAVSEDAENKQRAAIEAIDGFNETVLTPVPFEQVGYKAYRGKEISAGDIGWEAAGVVPVEKWQGRLYEC